MSKQTRQTRQTKHTTTKTTTKTTHRFAVRKFESSSSYIVDIKLVDSEDKDLYNDDDVFSIRFPIKHVAEVTQLFAQHGQEILVMANNVAFKGRRQKEFELSKLFAQLLDLSKEGMLCDEHLKQVEHDTAVAKKLCEGKQSTLAKVQRQKDAVDSNIEELKKGIEESFKEHASVKESLTKAKKSLAEIKESLNKSKQKTVT